jgi:hypothetical protein
MCRVQAPRQRIVATSRLPVPDDRRNVGHRRGKRLVLAPLQNIFRKYRKFQKPENPYEMASNTSRRKRRSIFR